jgi:hypothetical protein
MPATLGVLGGFPVLPDIALTLHQAPGTTPAVARLREILVQTLADSLGRSLAA